MTTVIDASVVVALLTDEGPTGAWAEGVSEGAHAIAPQLLPAEVANALRRLVRLGTVSRDAATLAHFETTELPSSCSPTNRSPSGSGPCART